MRIICVLKSGGDFDSSYVYKLFDSLKEYVKIPFTFHCLSDLQMEGISPAPLTQGLHGWWSKLEIFRFSGPALYLDLDTIITGNITDLIKEVELLHSDCFYMLEAFNSSRLFASGIMAWNGNWSWLTKSCIRNRSIFFWDQDCIYYTLKRDNIQVLPIHRSDHGIYSYKHHCREKVPEDAKVICFHGKPRPHEVYKDW